MADAWPSNVDKHSIVGQPAARLCNYTDVYKNASITESIQFMAATATEDQIERFRIRVGDTLITKDSETADDIGIPAYVAYEAPDLICGYHLSIVRPRIDTTHPRFLYWVLESQFAQRQWAVLASGVTRVALRRNDVSRVLVPVPPVSDQKRIADYLDRETAQIDTLIAKQEQLIATLRERREAVIGHAILSTSAPVVPVRRLASQIRQGWSPNCEAIPGDPHNEWSVLKVGCSNSGTFEPMQNKRLPDTESPRIEHVVRRGEVVLSRSNTSDLVGMAAVVDATYERLMLSDLTYALTPTAAVDPAFLALALRTPHARSQFAAKAKGTSPSMQKVSQRDVLSLVLPVPTREKQREVVTEVNVQTAKIDTLIAKAERFIELSKERRAALITAAVTGQLEVPAA